MKLICTYADPDKKIQAIKVIRAASGLGLKEAKEAADALTGSYLPKEDKRVLAAGLTRAAANAKLDILRDGGYADGYIELDDNEPTFSQFDVIDAVVDAIVLARANPAVLPSEILKAVLDRG